MMSLQTIRQLSRDAAIRAVRDNRIPFTVEPQDLVDWRAQFTAGKLRLPFPFLGDYVPQGWRRTVRDPLFVDSTGSGREDEPALTVRATIEALIPGKAYAIIEGGQFELYLGEYERDDDSPGNENEFVGLTSDEEQEIREIVKHPSQFAQLLTMLLQQEDRTPPMDFAVRFEGDSAYFTPLTPRAVEFIEHHIVGAVFDESGALVVCKMMGELMVCSIRREGLRLAVRGIG